jgi:hypothetical protein
MTVMESNKKQEIVTECSGEAFVEFYGEPIP